MQNSFYAFTALKCIFKTPNPSQIMEKGTLRSNHGNPKQPLFECAHECAKVRSCAPGVRPPFQPLIFAKTLNSLARAELTVIGTKVNQQTKANWK